MYLCVYICHNIKKRNIYINIYIKKRKERRIMNTERSFFVVDEGGFASPFSVDMFDDEGWLEGHENEDGYNIEDFDIIRYCDTWEEAVDIAAKYSDY